MYVALNAGYQGNGLVGVLLVSRASCATRWAVCLWGGVNVEGSSFRALVKLNFPEILPVYTHHWNKDGSWWKVTLEYAVFVWMLHLVSCSIVFWLNQEALSSHSTVGCFCRLKMCFMMSCITPCETEVPGILTGRVSNRLGRDLPSECDRSPHVNGRRNLACHSCSFSKFISTHHPVKSCQ